MNGPMKIGTATCSPVCVYHACFPQAPADIENHLHNIAPAVLHDHLSYLKKHYRMVFVDELAEHHCAGDVAAITFDDGYKSVLSNAAPILIDLEIPFTIFINNSSLEKRIFWRDKIRYLITHDLVKSCEQFLHRTSKIANTTFYRYTKHPSNNSRIVDDEISAFLTYNGCHIEHHQYCFEDINYLMDHHLIAYGNHSHNHYVLSSLSPEEQYQEIHHTKQFLESVPDIRVSQMFAVPFGDLQDLNQHTLAILKELGYRGILLSRQRLNCDWFQSQDLTVIERFMPRGPDMAEILANLVNARIGL
jgi:peptidoglycan/xylan/chitin deacetylase (PgdA/CDA1 family)